MLFVAGSGQWLVPGSGWFRAVADGMSIKPQERRK
jgi:hypothetical protein